MAQTQELIKKAFTEQFKVPTSEPAEKLSYMLKFDNVPFGMWLEEKIETGINASFPGAMIPTKMSTFVNSEIALPRSNCISYLSHDAGKTIWSPAADLRFEENHLYDSIVWDMKNLNIVPMRYQNDNFPVQQPIVEEELYLGFSYGNFVSDNVPPDYSTAPVVSGFVCIEFDKYKITKNKWLAIGNDNATGSRFI